MSTYNPKNPELYQLITTSLPILKADDAMRKVLEKLPSIKSKRQPKSLKKILTRAAFNDNETEERKNVTKCGRSNCGTCHYLLEGNSFSFSNGSTFYVKTNMNCSSNNLLYAIKCCGCNEDYIGQTGNELRKRITVHTVLPLLHFLCRPPL